LRKSGNYTTSATAFFNTIGGKPTLRSCFSDDAFAPIADLPGPAAEQGGSVDFQAIPDLPPEQYAYRPGQNAQQAAVEVEELLSRGHREVLDADLPSPPA
jgi:hypothetical protein